MNMDKEPYAGNLQVRFCEGYGASHMELSNFKEM